MQYNTLGNTSVKVSQVGLGTMTWGEQNNESEAFQQMDYALEKGVNFFDTAELYPVPGKAETYAKTEQFIGNWMQKNGTRKQVFLATKVAGPSSYFHWIRGENADLDSSNIELAIQGSLDRLKTDYIDLYQIHWPSRKTNFFGKLGYDWQEEQNQVSIEQTLLALKSLLAKGKIKHYGISNETPWGMTEYLRLSKKLLMPAPVSIQNPYSLLNRSFEIGCAEFCHREQVSLLAYSPLAFGMLSGKYLKGQNPENSRLNLFRSFFSRYSSNNALQATNLYQKLATKFNMSLTQMALAFVNRKKYCDVNIIGATSLPQLKENIESAYTSLNETILSKIDEIHELISNPSP